jgi:putative flavoprotein involved in K+ transport
MSPTASPSAPWTSNQEEAHSAERDVTIEKIDTVIIGGGQAGLAVSYYLGQLGRAHVILERQRVAERWRSERWDSLTFQFPNWAMQLPGYAYSGADPDGFAPRDEVVRFIESYAAVIRAPLRCGVAVTSLRQKPGSTRFQMQTEDAEIEAANVVIATGPYQKPSVPRTMEGAMRGLFQVHSSRYRNPAQLPAGAVLVVGSGNSGCQIAEDLLRGGRRVYLAVGAHRRAPRRYRGRDCTWWQFALGEFDLTTDKRPARKTARLLTGVEGGHDMDLRRLAIDGVVLLGHVLSAEEGKIALAPDLGGSLAAGDAWFVEFLKSADEYAQKNGLEFPDEHLSRERLPDPKEVSAPILELDLRAAGVSSVIWANGFSYDFGWVHFPVFGGPPRQDPIHQRGVTNIPGLYFIGLPWLSKLKSSLMAGAGEDAAFLVEHIAHR